MQLQLYLDWLLLWIFAGSFSSCNSKNSLRSIKCLSLPICKLWKLYSTDVLEKAIYTAIIYSWLSLSRPRISRITAYLEGKILSLLKHEIQVKILWKRGEIFSFPQYFNSPITYIFVKCGCSNYFFFSSANLICRGTDISKYFRESLGIRDNESRLYRTFKLWVESF